MFMLKVTSSDDRSKHEVGAEEAAADKANRGTNGDISKFR